MPVQPYRSSVKSVTLLGVVVVAICLVEPGESWPRVRSSFVDISGRLLGLLVEPVVDVAPAVADVPTDLHAARPAAVLAPVPDRLQRHANVRSHLGQSHDLAHRSCSNHTGRVNGCRRWSACGRWWTRVK